MMFQIFKKSLSYTLALMMILSVGYVFLEPSKLLAQSAVDTVQVTLTVDAGISITSPADVTMAPNLSTSANQSIGGTTWNVKTNSAGGYDLTVHASTTPALRQTGVADFADYTATPETWNPPSSSMQFGFSAYGDHVPTGTFGASTGCGAAGVPNASLNYRGFIGVTTITIATSGSTTTTAGVDSTVCFAAEQEGIYAPSGVYTANITATATVQ